MYRRSISDWTEEYGLVTCFSYLLYAELWEDEEEALANGLSLLLLSKGVEGKFLILTEEVSVKEARALGEHRGTQLQIVFPDSARHLERLVKKGLKDGLSALAIKHKFLEIREVKNLA